MTLDVAISTYRPDGILRVENMLSRLAPQSGVRFVVSWQEHENAPIPESLIDRGDVEVVRYDVKGLSNNRNNALAHSSADIVLIADDDLIFLPDFSVNIKEAFKSDPRIDLGIFKINFPNEKKYPDKDCRLRLPLPKGYYGSSVEIALRRERLDSLKFWGEMGLGNPFLHCGEDELFLISAIKRNYNCHFFNTTIANHPVESTGDKVSPGILRGRGFIIGLIYPFTCLLRIPLIAFRIRKKKKSSFLSSLIELSRGALLSIKKNNIIPKDSRW